MHNFIIFSLSRLNIEFGTNIRDISVELARYHKVLYIDVPLKRKQRWFNTSTNAVKEVDERIRSGKKLLEVSTNLWHYIDDEMLESVNGISNSFVFDTINKINNRRFARTIKKGAAAVGFDKYILLNDNDIYNGYYLREILNPHRYVYYLRDRLAAMTYWKNHAARLEPALIRKTDVVVANSQYLADGAAEFNAKSYYVGQGCDVTHFLKAPDESATKEALAGIGRPIVGYMGAINSERLDIDLIQRLALRMKDFNFVFVGQEDPTFAASELHSLPNVHFLGRKDFSELPVYLYGFDVTINPQAVNEITVGNYPRKVDEYLAAGKPVVATDTLAMKPFSEHVYLASGAADYEVMIRKAISENSEAKSHGRREFASDHTWENSVKKILQAIDNI